MHTQLSFKKINYYVIALISSENDISLLAPSKYPNGHMTRYMLMN